MKDNFFTYDKNTQRRHCKFFKEWKVKCHYETRNSTTVLLVSSVIKIKSLKYYLCPQQNMLQRQCNQTKTAVQVSYTVAAQQLGKQTLSRAFNLGTRVSLQPLKELCPKKMESFTGTRIFWNQFIRVTERSSPSQWPRGLRRRSTAARLLRSWVRIPPRAWMFVCCQVEVSATSWSFVQRSPTDCGVSLCVI